MVKTLEIFMKWNLLKMAYFLGNEVSFLGHRSITEFGTRLERDLISLDFISISNNFSYPFEIVVRGALFSWKEGMTEKKDSYLAFFRRF